MTEFLTEEKPRKERQGEGVWEKKEGVLVSCLAVRDTSAFDFKKGGRSRVGR